MKKTNRYINLQKPPENTVLMRVVIAAAFTPLKNKIQTFTNLSLRRDWMLNSRGVSVLNIM